MSYRYLSGASLTKFSWKRGQRTSVCLFAVIHSIVLFSSRVVFLHKLFLVFLSVCRLYTVHTIILTLSPSPCHLFEDMLTPYQPVLQLHHLFLVCISNHLHMNLSVSVRLIWLKILYTWANHCTHLQIMFTYLLIYLLSCIVCSQLNVSECRRWCWAWASGWIGQCLLCKEAHLVGRYSVGTEANGTWLVSGAIYRG